MSTPADDPRDPHLMAALRHAPDHEAAPPSALSAQIRAQARQARPAPKASTDPGWFERWFGWMSRPVAAGAFGTLLIAGFVGLMWREGPPPDALPGADRPAPAPAVAEAVPPPAQPPQPATTHVLAPAPPTPAPPPPPARAAVAPKPAEPVRARADAAPVPAAGPPSPAEARAPTREQSPAPVPAPMPQVATAPALVPAPAPMPATARAEAPAPAAPAAPLGAAGKVGASARARDNAAAPAAARLASPPAESAAEAAPDLSADPLAAAIAAADGPWRERLRTVRLQTQGRWAPVAALPDGEGETVTGANGQRLGRLHVQGLHITWQAADGRTWRATLPERSESTGPAPSR